MIPRSIHKPRSWRGLGSLVLLLALLSWTLPGLAQDHTFRDDFATTSWAENSGTHPFAGDWVRTGTPTRSVARGSVRIDGVGEVNDAITRSANLLLYGRGTLSFDVRNRNAGTHEAADQLIVEIAPSATGPWTNLRTYSGNVVGTVRFSERIDLFLTPATTIRFRTVGTTASNEGFELLFVQISATPAICFSDDFNAPPLNPNEWATQSVSGGFGAPRIVGNRLRLTDNTGDVSTAATLQRFFPGADNRVVVEFDLLAYAGSGADGIAVTLSNASTVPVAGGFGGSLGYAQRTGIPGFAGGWLGVGLDAFGNFSNPTEGRVGGPGFLPDAVALRGSGSGTTGYPYLAGTGTLTPGVDIAGTTPGPNHRYRIIMDHRAGVTGAQISVERNTGAGFAPLEPAFDIFAVNPAQAAVPANFRVSFTGSTGTSTNIHEIDNLQICTSNNAQPPQIINHFRFLHDGQGLTCEPESIVVQACLDPDCMQQVSGPIQLTLSPTGWVGGDTQTITSGQTLRLQRTTTGTLSLGVINSDPPQQLPPTNRCFVGGVEQANCNLAYVDAGLVHEVSNHVSDLLQNVTIRAVQTSDTTRACVPSFANVTRSVSFWSNYVDPATGTRSVAVNGGNIATAAPGTAFNLTFNASGTASITVRYPDAGAVRLFSRYTGSTATNDAGLVMNGQDDFIAKPRDFLLTVSGSGPGGAADATGPVFARAGVPFTATVTARNHSGVATPNFGREAVPEGVRLDSTLQAPLGGNNPMPVAAPGFGAFVGGVATGQWRWDEVGVITLTPRLADGDYLGYGTPAQPAPGNIPDVVGTALANVGRFIPARLAITPNTPVLANACAAGSFGYVGQEFGFATNPELTVSGRNALGAITGNYVNAGGAANAFWRLGGTLANRGYENTTIGTLATLSRTTDGGNASLDEQTGPPFDGTGRLTISGDRLTYAKPVAPEAPFHALIRLDLSAADLTDSDGVCFDDAQDGCDPLSIAAITGTQQRWGRIALPSAFGPELLDLQLPMRAEFFNGTAFIANPDDVCSVVSIAPLVDANPADALLPAETCVQDSGSPGASGQGCSVAGPLVQRYTPSPPIGGGGQFVFWLRAPGAGNAGILDVTPNVPAWLRFDWRGTGLTAPTARVGFGVFQGDRRAIFRREVY